MSDLPNMVHVFRGYQPDEFLDLMEAVEAQGGQLVPGVCRGEKYTLHVPTVKGRRPQQFRTAACMNESRVLVPFDGAEDTKNMVLVCAVDDAMALWPRFNNNNKEDQL